jgi:hypothetical protein
MDDMSFFDAFEGVGPMRDVPGVGKGASSSTNRIAHETRTEVRDLKFQMERLILLNQALWELLRTRLNLTDADLEAMIHEVDMRDGVVDGKITSQPVRCPTCGRVSNSRHAKCMYCGQLFEKPLFG